MKVYIVKVGLYSDSHIVAVTLNKEDAYKLRDAAEEDNNYHYFLAAQNDVDNHNNFASVLEVETDDYKIIDDQRRLYQVDIYSDSTVNVRLKGRCYDLLGVENCWVFKDARPCFFNVRANSKEEAKNIALDRFAEWRKKDERLD